ncbi:hypothetical protein Tco_1411374, partial [Tanacetum coccineum]
HTLTLTPEFGLGVTPGARLTRVSQCAGIILRSSLKHSRATRILISYRVKNLLQQIGAIRGTLFRELHRVKNDGQHNEKSGTLITPIRLTFGEEVDTNKRKDKEKGVVEVDDDLKKPYKEVLESLFTRRIIEFSAPTEQVLPIGKIELEVVFGNEGLSRRTMMKFKVVETSSPYNIILGRTRMRELCVVSSTTHAMMKFPTPRGIATLVPRKDAIFDCRQIEDRQVSPGESPEEKTGEKKEESSTEDVMINPAFPDQRVAIGTQFSSTCRNCNTPKIR